MSTVTPLCLVVVRLPTFVSGGIQTPSPFFPFFKLFLNLFLEDEENSYVGSQNAIKT